MIITSEKTGKQYKTVEECVAAEKAYDKEQAEKKALEAKKNDERKARAKRVEEKFKIAAKAKAEADEELRAFVKDYGSFHTTLTNENSTPWFYNVFDVLNSFLH